MLLLEVGNQEKQWSEGMKKDKVLMIDCQTLKDIQKSQVFVYFNRQKKTVTFLNLYTLRFTWLQNMLLTDKIG